MSPRAMKWTGAALILAFFEFIFASLAFDQGAWDWKVWLVAHCAMLLFGVLALGVGLLVGGIMREP